MKRELKPNWTAEEKRLGERNRKAWDDFFAEREARGGPPPGQGQIAEDAALAEVQQRHQDELLRYPNVVGVAPGFRSRKGKPTGESCLVVYVSRKVPRKELKRDQILPRTLDGIPVDVVETGEVRILPA
jgi:hypothetical protein